MTDAELNEAVAKAEGQPGWDVINSDRGFCWLLVGAWMEHDIEFLKTNDGCTCRFKARDPMGGNPFAAVAQAFGETMPRALAKAFLDLHEKGKA